MQVLQSTEVDELVGCINVSSLMTLINIYNTKVFC